MIAWILLMGGITLLATAFDDSVAFPPGMRPWGAVIGAVLLTVAAILLRDEV